jgi:hypothetical protein
MTDPDFNTPGDIRPCNPERDKDKRWSEITDFEIWMPPFGWVHASVAKDMEFVVQVSS